MPKPQSNASEPMVRRIVVVEDNTELREMLAALLKICGHDVRVAATGREALEVIVSSAADVALVDIGLPDLDGCEVARQLRSGPVGRNIHLVALTGNADEEDRRQAMAAGFDEYLIKPIEPARLLAVVGG
jgi:CheY-like chemotaxis protein